MIDQKIPNGVIYDPKPTDYMTGDGNIASEVRTNGDWTPYVPKGERQSGNGFDSNDCTGFAYTNVIETQFKFLKDKIPVATLVWLSQNGYLDENGDLNCSDRALGSMAGTTSAGNSLNKVADTARTQGLIPESKWPSVFTTYAEYYKSVPQDLLNLGKEFLAHFEMPYEQVPVNLTGEALKSAPLYVALVTCGGWSNAEPPAIAWCNAQGSNHCVALLKQNDYRIFDSYPIPGGSFIKDLSTDYSIPYFYKVLLNPKGVSMPKKFYVNDNGKIVLFVIDGFAATGVAAKDQASKLKLEQSLEFTGSEPIFNL